MNVMKVSCVLKKSGTPAVQILFVLLLLLSNERAFAANGPELHAVRDQAYLNLSWDSTMAKLQEASALNGPWQTMNKATNASWRVLMSGARKFYRLTEPDPGG